jgi:transcription antitermination factor NusG
VTRPSGALPVRGTTSAKEVVATVNDMTGSGLVWLAVQTWPRYEKKVAVELAKKEIEVFLPLAGAERQWSDRRSIVQLPLFPTYLFVRAPETFASRISVLRTNGVINFVGTRSTGSPIPESEIESIRILLTRGIPFENHAYLSVGQRVRIRGSSLDGVEGILVAKNEDFSLVVSIQIIQRSLAIRVSGYRVEAA